MREYLISEEGKFYKANLHSHSSLSDGKLTPEEMKALYKELGYSVLALTDHDLFIPRNDLTDEDFLILNGFEYEVNEPGNGRTWRESKSCHFCYIALDKDMTRQPMWRENYLFGNAVNNKHLVDYDKDAEPYRRVYSCEGISEMMKIGREAGFFVTYNHPTWSLESYPQYMGYEGMHAIEMFNGGCITGGYEDYNPRVYDDMLRGGKRVFIIGADDNHNRVGKESRWSDAGVAFTMIKAKSLDYKSVTDAMLRGDFYCSTGPEIYALYLEDGKIHVECSDADRIVATFCERRTGIAYAKPDAPLNYAAFDVSSTGGYVRITVTDEKGKHACSNAFYI